MIVALLMPNCAAMQASPMVLPELPPSPDRRYLVLDDDIPNDAYVCVPRIIGGLACMTLQDLRWILRHRVVV